MRILMRTSCCLLLFLLMLTTAVVAASSSVKDKEEALRAIETLNRLDIRTTYLCSLSDALEPEIPRCSSARRLDYESEEQEETKVSSSRWIHAVGAIVCVVVSALMAGLTVGLLGMEPLWLLMKARAGSSEIERQQAATLLPIVKQHHLLLVSLLLLNSLAGEALPVFLQGLLSEVSAVFLSVLLVLLFGEILPSAILTGANRLAISSRLAPVVKLAMVIVYPIAFPIAKLLDWLLHDDEDIDGTTTGSFYNRGELSALIRIQYEERLAAKQRRRHERHEGVSAGLVSGHVGGLDFSNNSSEIQSSVRALARRTRRDRMSFNLAEVSMVEGALQMKTKMAVDIYVPLAKVFMIPHDMVLLESSLIQIYSSGFSRIPVYQANQGTSAIRGYLLTRQLIVVNTNDEMPVSKLCWHLPYCVAPDTNLVDLVNMFQTGVGTSGRGGHMALVCARPDLGNAALEQDEPVPERAGLMGIITLEDVLEALLQEAIYDEMDAASMASPTETSGAPEGHNEEIDAYHRVEDVIS